MSLQLDSAVGERLKFGEFELAPVARALWRRGEHVRLGSRALEILIALASRPGQIVSKDDLTQLVWRGAFVDETALRVGISAVRKALGPAGDRYIATVPCRGYCFVIDVETTATKPMPARPHFKRLKPQRLPAQSPVLSAATKSSSRWQRKRLAVACCHWSALAASVRRPWPLLWRIAYARSSTGCLCGPCSDREWDTDVGSCRCCSRPQSPSARGFGR